jgi:prophage regulatory protein
MAYNEPSVTQLLPNTGYLRIRQIVGDKAKGIQPLIPISRSGWFAGVREGRFPAGVLLGKRTRVWLAADILSLIESTSSEQGAR